jgi:hypothetical protein
VTSHAATSALPWRHAAMRAVSFPYLAPVAMPALASMLEPVTIPPAPAPTPTTALALLLLEYILAILPGVVYNGLYSRW